MENTEQNGVRPRPQHAQVRKSPSNPVQGLIYAVDAGSRPWWAETLSVFRLCVLAIYMPIRVISEVSSALVSLAFLAVLAAIGLWYAGYIPDAVVVKYLSIVGDRLFGIVKNSGLI